MDSPTTLKIGQVPAFLQQRYGFKVTRQSVYNWINKGLRNATLRVSREPGGAITTPGWIAEFFHCAGIDLALVGSADLTPDIDR